MQFGRFVSMGSRVAILTILMCANLRAVGQTENQLSTRLKKVVVFETRPGIYVFPTFSESGDVCRMVIQRTLYLGPGNADFDGTIPNEFANKIVDELVPVSEKGKPLSPYFSHESFVAGGASFLKKDYENVSVGMYGSLVEGKVGASVIVISWPKRTCTSRP